MSKNNCCAAVLTIALAGIGTAKAANNEVYITVHPISPLISSETTFYLADGNVNADYANPATSVGYLDGPELSVFDWRDLQSNNCEPGHTQCASISTSQGHLGAGPAARPHWGVESAGVDHPKGKDAATVYYVLRNAIRDYFDVHSSIGLPIQDVSNQHELVVLLQRPSSVGCSGACMRPYESDRPEYQILASVRPDGQNGGVSYNHRPKIFLGEDHLGSVRVPVHEFGHYYTRVFAMNYGLGGGFNRHGPWEERSLDEGLSYWFVSDFASTYYPGRWDPSSPEWPTYPMFSRDPGGSAGEARLGYNEHHLGDVMTSALWHGRELSGCAAAPWTEAVFSLVDSVQGASYGSADPFESNSIMRGFARSFLDQLQTVGACTQEQARIATGVFAAHGLIPKFVDQRDSGATNEGGDTFGYVVASGDFNHDGYDDMVVGAPGENEEHKNNTGMVHVFYGTPQGIVSGGLNPAERLNQSTQGSELEDGDMFGAAVAVGDFNGDGFDDLVVGVPYEDLEGGDDAGYVHVFYGSPGGLLSGGGQKFSQTSVGSTNETDDRFGQALTTGDFNGDGYGDLAIGAPGEHLEGGDDAGFLWVTYGSPAGLDLAGALRVQQESMDSTSEPGDAFAAALGAGDFNHDGYDDLVVGAPGEDTEGGDGAGFVFVLYGSSSGINPAQYQKFSQSFLGSTSEDGDAFGAAIAVGDFDADGFDDLVLGAPGERLSGQDNAGFLFLLYGSPSGVMSGRWQKWDQEAGGSTNEEGDVFAAALTAGDLDGDGYDDLVVGIPGERLSPSNHSGFTHIYFGTSSGIVPGNAVRASQQRFLSVNGDGDWFGQALAAGDFDGDGRSEVAIGAPGKARAGQSSVGVAYVVGKEDLAPAAEGTIEVHTYALDEAMHEGNITKPRVYLENTGTRSLDDFKVYYYLNVTENRVPRLDDYYTPGATPVLEWVGGTLYRVVFDYFDQSLRPGQRFPDSAGSVIGIHFDDWSPWNKDDDPSHAGVGSSFAEVVGIAVVDCGGNVLAGRLLEGSPPPQEVNVGDIRVFARDEAMAESNATKPRIYLQNIGAGLLSDFFVYYYFNVSEGKAPVLEDWYTPDSTASLQRVRGNLYRVVYNHAGMALGPGQVLPNIGGSVVGLHFADWGPWNKSDDPSHAGIGSSFTQTNGIAVVDAAGRVLVGHIL